MPPEAIPTPPPPADPKELETAKAAIRNMLQEKGLPPDQIESQLNAMVGQAQRGLPPSSRAPDPPRQPPPGFGEGFADRWFSTEQGIKNLLGQGGPGAPGVLESWGGLVQGAAETAVNPAGAAVEEITNAVNSPSPAYYLGEKTFDAASTAATLPFGGEGAAVRAGLPEAPHRGRSTDALIRDWDPVGGLPWTDFEHFGTPGPDSARRRRIPTGLPSPARPAASGDHHRQVRPRRGQLSLAGSHALHGSRFVTGIGIRTIQPIRGHR